MKIAVLGAGLAGLAVTYHLTRYSKGRSRIDLFDPEPIGKGPAAIALGLLHPYMGKKAQRAWRADSCLEHAHDLITAASTALNEPIALSKGVVRPAIDAEQAALFEERSKESHQLELWSAKEAMKKLTGLHIPDNSCALFVKEGWTIHIQRYLEGLFKACLTHGVVFKQLRAVPPKMLEQYDQIVMCLGANSLGFGDFKKLPMTPIKGQVMRLKWPNELPPLPMSLVGDKQIVMAPDQKSCWVGATYERDFKDFMPHQDQAWELIMPKVTAFFPSLSEAKVLEVRSGFRASSKSHLPLAGQHGKFWFLTGLGSRGLLYHAWLGRRLAQAISGEGIQAIPEDVLYKLA